MVLDPTSDKGGFIEVLDPDCDSPMQPLLLWLEALGVSSGPSMLAALRRVLMAFSPSWPRWSRICWAGFN